jgi:hypothetical protein
MANEIKRNYILARELQPPLLQAVMSSVDAALRFIKTRHWILVFELNQLNQQHTIDQIYLKTALNAHNDQLDTEVTAKFYYGIPMPEFIEDLSS